MKLSRKYSIAGGISQVFLMAFSVLSLASGYSPGQELSLPALTVPASTDLFGFMESLDRPAILGIIACIFFVWFAVLLALPVAKSDMTSSPSFLAGFLGPISGFWGIFYHYLPVLNGGVYYIYLNENIEGAPWQLIPPNSVSPLDIVFLACVGGTLILNGLFFIFYHRQFRINNVAKATGVFYVIACVSEFSVFLDVAGLVTMLIAGFAGLVCFFKVES
jgi:hypothetical protein